MNTAGNSSDLVTLMVTAVFKETNSFPKRQGHVLFYARAGSQGFVRVQ